MRNVVPAVDPLLAVWAHAIKWLRLHHNEHGQALADDEEAMTQAQLGAALDPPVSQGCVARWEAGLREPKRKYKAQIEDFFEVPRGTIFVDDPAKSTLAKLPIPQRNRVKAVA